MTEDHYFKLSSVPLCVSTWNYTAPMSSMFLGEYVTQCEIPYKRPLPINRPPPPVYLCKVKVCCQYLSSLAIIHAGKPDQGCMCPLFICNSVIVAPPPFEKCNAPPPPPPRMFIRINMVTYMHKYRVPRYSCVYICTM